MEQVIKRDGTLQKFDRQKIEHAILKAFYATDIREIPDDLNVILDDVVGLLGKFGEDGHYGIEDIEMNVQNVLQLHKHQDVAECYANYKQKRDQSRDERLSPDPSAIIDFITTSKYAKHVKSENRRETWQETIDRTKNMHINKFPQMHEEISNAFDYVDKGLVLPSMRSLQFGGKGVEQHNVRLYNCSWTLANRLRVFQETFYNLLCGAGCGLSVQFKHVAQLPKVKQVSQDDVKHYHVQDDIQGWADSIGEIIKSYFITGQHVEFDYSLIRDKGSELSTSGGKAPGHLALKKLHEQLREQLDACTFRKLRPIEVADVICKIAEAVLAGGIRRSSIIILFSADDSEMVNAKVPGNFEWEGKNYWRRMMNISAVCNRDTTTRETIERLIRTSRDFGDPGIYWTDNEDCGCNPCGEIGMYPRIGSPDDEKAVVCIPYDEDECNVPLNTGQSWMSDSSLGYEPRTLKQKYKFFDKQTESMLQYGHDTGWQFCNLCEVNVAKCQDTETFYAACRAAAFIGTLQASYTYMPYLGCVTELIVEREALIGVGLTGMCDNPEIGFDQYTLLTGRDTVKNENRRVAQLIGINPAARLTTVKPSGTASLVLGCVGSGIHPHHARRYFRRVTENPTNPVAQWFKKHNPHMVETKPDGNLCLTFCVESPANAVTVKELAACKFMHDIFNVYEAWIEDGINEHVQVCKTLRNNVSCTVVVSEDEWADVIDKFWENRHRIGAMSFLPRMGDKNFPYMPREEVVTAADEARWNYLIEGYTRVDYTKLIEKEDNTERQAAPACTGGTCDV